MITAILACWVAIHRALRSPQIARGDFRPLPAVVSILRVDSFYVIRMVAAGQDGVVTAAQCRQAGLTPDQVKTLCRDRRWLRINRGAYLVDADVEEEPARRSLIRAAVLSAGPHAVAVLGAAAELHRIAGLRPDPVVHLSLPGVNARPRRPTESDVRLHQFTIDPSDVTVIDGIAVTTPARTLADLLLRVDRFTAVCLLDSALNRGSCQQMRWPWSWR